MWEKRGFACVGIGFVLWFWVCGDDRRGVACRNSISRYGSFFLVFIVDVYLCNLFYVALIPLKSLSCCLVVRAASQNGLGITGYESGSSWHACTSGSIG